MKQLYGILLMGGTVGMLADSLFQVLAGCIAVAAGSILAHREDS